MNTKTQERDKRQEVIRDLVIGIIASIIGGLIAALINRLIADYFDTVSMGVDLGIAIYRPGGYFAITVFWILFFFCLITVVSWIPSFFKTTRTKWFTLSIGLFILALVLITFFYLTIPARVDSTEVIHGKVTKDNFKYCLLVRPVISSKCWVQNTILPDHQGNWETTAFFGGYGRFEIILLAAEKKFDFPCKQGYTLSFNEIAKYKNRVTRRVIRVN